MTRAICLTAAAFAALAAGCDYFEPDVGSAAVARCVDDDTDPATDVSFSADIVPIIQRGVGGCVPCHDPRSENPVGVTLSGLDLTSRDALIAGGVRTASDIVVPGEPCGSALYLKLLPGPPFGARMPGDGPPYLTEDEQTLFHDWIAEGAGAN